MRNPEAPPEQRLAPVSRIADSSFDGGPADTGGIFADRERKAAEAKEEAVRQRDENFMENLAERVKVKMDAEMADKAEVSVDPSWEANQAARDRFSQRFEILKLAVEHAAEPDEAPALADKYKEWMDK